MDLHKYFAIGHHHHTIFNPLSEEKLDEIIELLDLPAGARVLDIACGNAAFLCRTAEHWKVRGHGVDISAEFIRRAHDNIAHRGLDASVSVTQLDGAAYESKPNTYALASCLGASWIWKGFAGTLDALAVWTKPGGLVVVGEPYLKKTPQPEYLQAAGFEATTFGSHAQNVDTGLQRNLIYLHSVAASADDWDRYEGYQSLAIERYAQSHPDDPDVAEMLNTLHRFRDSYLSWGRETLGWAVYMFLKPV